MTSSIQKITFVNTTCKSCILFSRFAYTYVCSGRERIQCSVYGVFQVISRKTIRKPSILRKSTGKSESSEFSGNAKTRVLFITPGHLLRFFLCKSFQCETSMYIDSIISYMYFIFIHLHYIYP